MKHAKLLIFKHFFSITTPNWPSFSKYSNSFLYYSPGPDSVDLAKKNPKNDIDIRKVPMLVHLFPKYFEIIFFSSVYGSVWTRWPPKRSNPRFGLIFLVLKLASQNFRDLLDIFYWLQCTFQILRFFEFGQK